MNESGLRGLMGDKFTIGADASVAALHPAPPISVLTPGFYWRVVNWRWYHAGQ